ncbi:MAG: M48 family metalloprotease [Terriglobia bacterium]
MVLILILASIALAPAPASAQACGHWAEVLVQSFIPKQIDEKSLREFSNLSPEEYFRVAREIESAEVRRLAEARSSLPNVDFRLRSMLHKFYDSGFQLYGVRLSADNFAIKPGVDVNAFASGSMIIFNEGIVRYFLDGWKNDWNSLYFVLAHEAAHNLMRHRDEKIFELVHQMFEEYREAILNHRKDIAHGRSGGGVKRYLWKSLRNVLEGFETAQKRRRVESEADVVALLLLRRSGFDPSIAQVASQRMALLVGGKQVKGWQGAMTEVLCSTHPDWMLRIQEIQRSLNCLRFSGNVCEGHIAYPVEDFLPRLQGGMDYLDEYQQETLDLAEWTPADSGSRFEVKIEVKPRDAQLLVNGERVSPGKLRLALGRHVVRGVKEGYEPSEKTIVVFPDVHPRLKIKLKKKK